MVDVTGLIQSAASAAVGGAVVGKIMIVAGKVVLALGQQEIENSEKRERAIAALYRRLPIFSRMVPQPVLAKIVEVVWLDLIKPALVAQPPKAKG